MGACATKSSHDFHDVKRRRKESIHITNESSSEIQDENNLKEISLRNERKINTSSGEIAYDTSTDYYIHDFNNNNYYRSSSIDKIEHRKYSSSKSDHKMVQLSPYHHLWSIGCNKNGAQGNGTKHNVLQPKKMTSLPDNISVNNMLTGNCGSTYLLCDDTKLFVWGYNEYGSISMDNKVIENIIQIWSKYQQIPQNIIDILIKYIEKIDAFKQTLKPCCIYNDHWIKCLSKGITSFHRFLLLQNNELYGIGKNGWNQLGVKHDFDHRNLYHSVKINYFNKNGIVLKQIATSLTYTIFLSENGEIYSCGKSKNGGLGLGKNLSWLDGIQQIIGLKYKITSIACGESHTLALNCKQQVLSWG